MSPILHRAIVGCCLYSVLSGCVVIDGKSRKWYEETIQEEPGVVTGPGEQDGGIFTKRQKVLRETDTGRYMSIGIMPGLAGPSLTGDTKSETGIVIMYTPIANFFLGIPTIIGLFFAPWIDFDPPREKNEIESELMFVRTALIGCYRWKDSAIPVRNLEVSLLEKQLSNHGINYAYACEDPVAINDDGMKIYLEYPSFDRLKNDVDNGEKVAVLFWPFGPTHDTTVVRHFRKSSYDASSSMAYEDDHNVGINVKRKAHQYVEMQKLRNEIDGIPSSEELGLDAIREKLVPKNIVTITDSQLEEINRKIQRCKLYNLNVLPLRNRVASMMDAAPKDQKLKTLYESLSFKNAVTEEQKIDAEMEINELEQRLGVMVSLTNTIAGLSVKLPGCKELKRLSANLEPVRPSSMDDKKVQDIKTALSFIEKRFNEVSARKKKISELKALLPHNSQLEKLSKQLETDDMRSLSLRLLHDVSEALQSIKERYDECSSLSIEIQKLSASLPGNKSLAQLQEKARLDKNELADGKTIAEMKEIVAVIKRRKKEIGRLAQRINNLVDRHGDNEDVLKTAKLVKSETSTPDVQKINTERLDALDRMITTLEREAPRIEKGIEHLDDDGKWREEAPLIAFATTNAPALLKALDAMKKRLVKNVKALESLNKAVAVYGSSHASQEICGMRKREIHSVKRAMAEAYIKLETACIVSEKLKVFPGSSRLKRNLDVALGDCARHVERLKAFHFDNAGVHADLKADLPRITSQNIEYAVHRLSDSGGWRNEVALYSFISSCIPTAETAINGLQTRLGKTKQDMKRLKEELEDFGVASSNDNTYQRLCDRQSTIKAELAELYLYLERAHMAKLMADGMPDNKSLKYNMQKAVNDCLQIINKTQKQKDKKEGNK